MKTEAVRMEAGRLAKEQRLRKAVYNAIVALSECVVETTLQEMVLILISRYLHANFTVMLRY